MTKRYFYLVSCDLQSHRFDSLYFESFSAAVSFVETFFKDNENYPLSITKVSFNFG